MVAYQYKAVDTDPKWLVLCLFHDAHHDAPLP